MRKCISRLTILALLPSLTACGTQYTGGIDTRFLAAATAVPSTDFGKMMARAMLDAVMGVGTVFLVLGFIIILISSFSFIGKFQNREMKQETEEKKTPDVKILMETEIEENLQDDLELVAVITAAVAAYEGETDSSGYIVRRIKRRKNERN